MVISAKNLNHVEGAAFEIVNGLSEGRRSRPSIPGPGTTISSSSEKRALWIRSAVSALESQLAKFDIDKVFFRLFGSSWIAPSLSSPEPLELRASWALINCWLLGRNAGALTACASITEAESWFAGRLLTGGDSLAKLIPKQIQKDAVAFLQNFEIDEDLRDLLPYALEPFGPGTRLSIMRDPSTRVARDAKRDSGVYYTPADVAEFMVSSVLAEHSDPWDTLKCLDASCGTGVFLRALLNQVGRQLDAAGRINYALNCLFGFDKSALAVETCAFVLMHELLPDINAKGLIPWGVWQALRLNLIAIDSLVVHESNGRHREDLVKLRADYRESLLQGSINDSLEPFVAPICSENLSSVHSHVLLNEIVPEASEGFEIIIGNPPYAAIGRRADANVLREQFASLGAKTITGRENAYPLFVEMMWRLARKGRSVSSLVVPLSIAFHQGSQFQSCRAAMVDNGGTWQCCFFDREPHALFGEDVKTRNAILFRRDSKAQRFEINTGPLRRWTSRTRHQLFSSISYTPVVVEDVSQGIPKLEGALQAHTLNVLRTESRLLGSSWRKAYSILPENAFVEEANPWVFVASTAYNFLNVFRCLGDRNPTDRLSKNPVLLIEFDNQQLANAGLAVLSSRLVYWYWHVWSDGFHVPRSFIAGLPFDLRSLSTSQLGQLSSLGAELWSQLKAHRFTSNNAGSTTIGFNPLQCGEIRDQIDRFLIASRGLEAHLVKELREFVAEKVIVDPKDQRRKQFSFLLRGEE